MGLMILPITCEVTVKVRRNKQHVFKTLEDCLAVEGNIMQNTALKELRKDDKMINISETAKHANYCCC